MDRSYLLWDPRDFDDIPAPPVCSGVSSTGIKRSLLAETTTNESDVTVVAN